MYTNKRYVDVTGMQTMAFHTQQLSISFLCTNSYQFCEIFAGGGRDINMHTVQQATQ